jgi:hypothetical protein
MGVQFDETRTFEENGRTFRILVYAAYNAMGLIGSECNGVAVLDVDNKSVVCDELHKIPVGFHGASADQMAFAEYMMHCDWEHFRDAVNNSHRNRVHLESAEKPPAELPKCTKIDTSKFTDAEFMTADEKRLVLKQWCRFVAGGFKREHWTKRVYQHLINHCSFIAHFNANGFYAHYFSDSTMTRKFLSQFDRKAGCVSVEYGMTYWIRGGNDVSSQYYDLNNAMVDAVAPVLSLVQDMPSARLTPAGG